MEPQRLWPFGTAGYEVIINYGHDSAALERTTTELQRADVTTRAVQADIYTEAGITALFNHLKASYQGIDVFINNAGGPPEPDFGDYDRTAIIASLDGGFISAALCTQAAASLMKPGGCILFTSSIDGLYQCGSSNRALYSAGKAAIINFAQTMAQELAPRKIRCNIVVPGMTKTTHWKTQARAYTKQCLAMSLQHEFVEPEEVANAFLLLAESLHAIGSTLVPDVGWSKKFAYEG